MELPKHGANPSKVYANLGIERPTDVVDFSENINPAGPPKIIQEVWADLATKITSYPDPDGEPFLSTAAEFHCVEKASIFVGNGAAELLAFVAERYRDGKAIVVHPTFSEYEATLAAKEVDVIRVLSTEENGFKLPIDQIKEAMESASVLYLCTPNNPTGIMPERDDLVNIIRFGAEMNCDIVLDEAFIDFIGESRSFIAELSENPHVTIIRSMTKMYAIPGIRLGYVLAHPTIINEIKALAPHWNVNGVAAQIGALCLDVDNYRKRAIQHSNAERLKMKVFLEARGCIVTDSEVNFLTFKPGEGQTARKLYLDLLNKGIVLRHTENFQGMDGHWLRIGMKKVAEMNALKEELTRWFVAN